MIDILSLVCYLEARSTHTEVHGIHVNHIWHRLFLGCCFLCLCILKAWHLNVNLFSPPIIDSPSKTKESRMWASRLFWNEQLMCKFISNLETIGIILLDLFFVCRDSRGHTIINTKYWTG